MIEALIHRIRIRQAEIKEALATGLPMTWEAYQRLVGEHQGLEGALTMIENMLEEEKNYD